MEQKNPVPEGKAAGLSKDAERLNVAIRESEDRFRSIVEQAPMGIGLLTGPEMVLEVANESMFQLWGKDKSATGKRLIDFLPEIKGQGFPELLATVYRTGEPYFGTGTLAKLVRNGQLENAYFNFAYTPIRTDGVVSGVMVLATEVTEMVLAQQSVQTSEARLRAVISSAPAAMSLFIGRDLVVEMPNQAFIDIAAQGRQIVGKPLREAMPELIDQPFMQILDDVYTSGKTYEGFGVPGDIIQDGQLIKHYFNFSYSPLFDADGKVYGILDITVDVTEQMKAQQQIQEAESLMRGAAELAQLGIWSVDVESGRLSYSERMFEWCGVDPQTGHTEDNFSQVEPGDRQRVREAMDRALERGSDGLFDEEFTVFHAQTGRKRVLHAYGKAVMNEEGVAVRIMGTAQDITIQRQVQMTLEHQIQERTEELDASNEELQAANEELAAINEELAELNDQLANSNEDLQQFAHVTSHDLKEPLRKMKTFLSRMEDDPNNHISPQSKIFLERIKISAARMSDMIEGVLKYSTINAGNQRVQPVDLNDVMKNIVVDLEMLIAQKRATVHTEGLPVVEGAAVLLYQLLYNLVINALKFTSPGTTPIIRVTGEKVVKNNLDLAKIEIEDNGIGFDQQNAVRIFDTFIRLNTKDEYEGTGLGLALCKKIVVRHHGTIEARSQSGKGSVFTIWLPFEQPHTL